MTTCKFFFTVFLLVCCAGCQRTAITAQDHQSPSMQPLAQQTEVSYDVNCETPDCDEYGESAGTDVVISAIDSRVDQIKAQLNNEWQSDYYEVDNRVFHNFSTGSEEYDSLAIYYLFYGKSGELIYAEITHYRAAHYAIYFQSDALYHVEVGPFADGGVFISGGLEDVKSAITKDDYFAFVLEDVTVCLSAV